MIYFDNASTTKPNYKNIEENLNLLKENYFNASSVYHGGIEAKRAIKIAKDTFLNLLSVENHDLAFTSSGTESDNLAILGSFKRGTAVSSSGEHSAVYQTLMNLANTGKTVKFAKLNRDGSVNVEDLVSLIDNETSFVSIMHVNNETGAINDIVEIAKKIKSINKNIIFHSDGVQAFGKINFKLNNDIDLYSISSHKIEGIKGNGALFYKKKSNLTPLIFGGGQENNLVSGTENVFGIKVFESCAKTKFLNLKNDFLYVENLKKEMLKCLAVTNCQIISSVNSSPYILSVSFVGLRGEVLLHMLEKEGVMVSTGSACSSKNRFSRVLKECGYLEKELDGVIRISFSSNNTLDEIRIGAEKINNCVVKLRKIIK